MSATSGAVSAGERRLKMKEHHSYEEGQQHAMNAVQSILQGDYKNMGCQTPEQAIQVLGEAMYGELEIAEANGMGDYFRGYLSKLD